MGCLFVIFVSLKRSGRWSIFYSYGFLRKDVSAALFQKGTWRKGEGGGQEGGWWFDDSEFTRIRTFEDTMAISVYIYLMNTIGYWEL